MRHRLNDVVKWPFRRTSLHESSPYISSTRGLETQSKNLSAATLFRSFSTRDYSTKWLKKPSFSVNRPSSRQSAACPLGHSDRNPERSSPQSNLNQSTFERRGISQRARSTHVALDAPTLVKDKFAEEEFAEEKCAEEGARPWEEVPGPKPLPLLGNTWRFIPYIGGYSVQHIDRVCVSLRREYGRCVRLAGLLGRPDMLFLFDADEVERVFRSEDALPHRPSMPSLDYYKHVLRKDFFGAEENCAGVIAVHGEAWSTFRGRVARVVLRGGAAAQYAAPAASVADAFVRRVRVIRDHNLEMPADFLNELHKWSLESLALVALDRRMGCLDDAGVAPDSETQQLIDAVHAFFLSVGELELRAPWWRLYPTAMFRRYIAALDTILGVTLRHVQLALEALNSAAGVGGRSLLQQLVSSAGPKVASVAALDLFLVGIDTTSNAVASILYQLSLRPEVQDKLHEEITRVAPDGQLRPADLSRMVYLKACIKEVLRMYPVVIGNGRQLTKDTIICGYNIPKGTQVIFQHYVMSNSDEYFDHANQFRPERWLRSVTSPTTAHGSHPKVNGTLESSTCTNHPQSNGALESSTCTSHPQANGALESSTCAHHPFASLPFGYGKRMCLGRRFADLEIQTIVCKMVQAFKMEYHHAPLDYHIHPMYTPNGPLRLKLIDR